MTVSSQLQWKMKFITRLILWVIILDNYELDQESERNIFSCLQGKLQISPNCSYLHEFVLDFNLTYNATQITVLDMI